MWTPGKDTKLKCKLKLAFKTPIGTEELRFTNLTSFELQDFLGNSFGQFGRICHCQKNWKNYSTINIQMAKMENLALIYSGWNPVHCQTSKKFSVTGWKNFLQFIKIYKKTTEWMKWWGHINDVIIMTSSALKLALIISW